MTTGQGDTAVEVLDVGASPRAPLPRRGRLLVAGLVVAVAASVTTVLLTRPAGGPAPVAGSAPVATDTPSRSTGFAAGPVLVPGDDHDEVTVPGAAEFGGAAMNVALLPDASLVASVRATIPSFDHVRGGRVADPETHYGCYLQGAYTGAGGVPVQLTLYTARAAGTPQSRRSELDRVLSDGVTLVRTDSSFYTGTGWWVHAVALAPDGTDAGSGQADLLQRLVSDSRLVA